MFTGLVSARGLLAARDEHGPSARVVIRPVEPLAEEPLVLGESIAIDGACLSVAQVVADSFAVDATAETLARTTLGAMPIGGMVNLERAIRAADRLGGHLVTGHVDGVGTLAARHEVGDALALSFSIPPPLSRFVAEKGSIAINGVSMTVNATGRATFDVMVIPLTRAQTNLGSLAPGAHVNLEVDLIARYVARLIDADRG